VHVFDFDTRKTVGNLTGFNNPYGDCVDKKGDVFLTTEIKSAGAVLEYSHGGQTPINSFDTDGHPIGCSISPISGDLAVDNGLPSGGSDVEIWTHASGTPTSYVDEQDCQYLYPPGYDDKGNLFAETTNASSVCELAAGAQSLTAVTFEGKIGYPGSVMWDGAYITFTDQSYYGYSTAIYQAALDASGNLRVVNTTVLSSQGCGADIIQPFIVGKKNTPDNSEQGTVVVGGNQGCDSRSPVWYWRYPQGGGPIKRIRHSLTDVVGQVVSIGR
jgi:hypothetical protein